MADGLREAIKHSLRKLDGPLVIDFDNVLFDDRDVAVLKVNEAVKRGVLVGIHTYYPGDPRLQRFLNSPNVIVAKTHNDLLAILRREAA